MPLKQSDLEDALKSYRLAKAALEQAQKNAKIESDFSFANAKYVGALEGILEYIFNASIEHTVEVLRQG